VSNSAFTFVAHLLLVGQAVDLLLAPKTERVAFVLVASPGEKVIDRFADQRGARHLLLLRQFVQFLELAIAEIDERAHRDYL
jgi:hypothetical protein